MKQPPGPPDLPLFSWTPEPFTLARGGDPETSHEAALAITSHVTEIQAEVLAYARSCGPAGFTDIELNRHVGSIKSTYRTRRRELVTVGAIENSGAWKHHGSMRRHTIWRIVGVPCRA